MIKTDKVVYRTRTREEYDWLMGSSMRQGVNGEVENNQESRETRIIGGYFHQTVVLI